MLRLDGSAQYAYDLYQFFESITANQTQENVSGQTAIRRQYQRGDAQEDFDSNPADDVDVQDASAIAQYLAGNKSLFDLNAVNASSPRHEGTADKITVADAMFVAQYLSTFRDAYFDPVGWGNQGQGNASVQLRPVTEIHRDSAIPVPVPVSVKGITDPNGLGSYDLEISFNPQVINVDSISPGNAPFGSPAASKIDNVAGKVLINGYHSLNNGPTADTVVAYLNVKSIGVIGSSNLGVAVNTLSDTFGDDIVTTVQNGIVTVRSGDLLKSNATLQGTNRPPAGREVTVTVRFHTTGQSLPEIWDEISGVASPIATFTGITYDTGSNAVFFQAFLTDGTPIPPTTGTYDVSIVSPHTLANLRRNVVIVTGINETNLGTLLEGNCNDDRIINALDFSILAAAYGTHIGDLHYDPRADFDRDGSIGSLDMSLLQANYLKFAPIVVTGSLNPLAPETFGKVQLTMDRATEYATAGSDFQVLLRVDTGGQQVAAVDTYIDFDPESLEVTGISGGSALPITLLKRFDNSAGTIGFAAGTLESNAPNGNFILATIHFKAKSKLGDTKISFSRTSARPSQAAYQGAPLLDTASGISVRIGL